MPDRSNSARHKSDHAVLRIADAQAEAGHPVSRVQKIRPPVAALSFLGVERRDRDALDHGFGVEFETDGAPGTIVAPYSGVPNLVAGKILGFETFLRDGERISARPQSREQRFIVVTGCDFPGVLWRGRSPQPRQHTPRRPSG